ncbi:MAG: hypothetical protein A3G59_02915 [Candidatus Taylorbacteria bacterium RIFCSPLOWO2_12_FULL_47_20]|uniref:Uncharacterized protein n=2 Tax=Candidatus Tayloriibacteriota TaxID=1817919 RepID=A0A1G2P6D1_9BACT|nr:MAG: hypothetical protein A3H68_00790 [Candidatus Taylorbacteria bacterium RIFCSPLOWO2_02_FULL_46_40]OHA43897.1 MAG: hypothetical protein A3G59_02915 [Candidatus Taylorbacteria bacterium RIFCSPLOWO2_12_FULL_47_20]
MRSGFIGAFFCSALLLRGSVKESRRAVYGLNRIDFVFLRAPNPSALFAEEIIEMAGLLAPSQVNFRHFIP